MLCDCGRGKGFLPEPASCGPVGISARGPPWSVGCPGLRLTWPARSMIQGNCCRPGEIWVLPNLVPGQSRQHCFQSCEAKQHFQVVLPVFYMDGNDKLPGPFYNAISGTAPQRMLSNMGTGGRSQL